MSSTLDISQGEWIFSEQPDSESADAGIVAGDHIIATIHHITRIGPAPDFGVTWGHYGDGYLMAAAPDLYAACLRVIDCEGDGTIFEPDSPFAAVVDAVRKAQRGMQ